MDELWMSYIREMDSLLKGAVLVMDELLESDGSAESIAEIKARTAEIREAVVRFLDARQT